VDNCQHVLMRCCVNLLDFYERIGAAGTIDFYYSFRFVDRQGRWSTLSASRWLPAPLHLIPSLLRFRSMTGLDKITIAIAMVRLARLKPADLQDYKTTFGDWLRRVGQTPNSIECFWRPVVVSALNEEPDRTAAAYAFQLFREAFLRSRRAFEMGLPRVELADLYSGAGGAALARLGVEVRCGERVSRILIEEGRAVGVCVDEERIPAEIVISAVPYHALPALLDEKTRSQPPFSRLSEFESSPITGVHLWFDRSVTDLPHAALLGREMQWIFNKDGAPTEDKGRRTEDEGKHPRSRNPIPDTPDLIPNTQDLSPTRGSYLGLLVSASRGLTSRTRDEIVAMAMEATQAVFPAAREARLIRALVIREKRATFSPQPGAEALRPDASTGVAGLYLAGDWTRTGWPATMEGAVRGGYLAAEQILHDSGQSVSLLAPEPPADLIPRLMGL